MDVDHIVAPPQCACIEMQILLGAVLNGREHQVVASRWGLAAEPRTLDAVGRTLKVTRERVRQIQTKAESRVIERGAHMPRSADLVRLLRSRGGTISETRFIAEIAQTGWGGHVADIRAAALAGELGLLSDHIYRIDELQPVFWSLDRHVARRLRACRHFVRAMARATDRFVSVDAIAEAGELMGVSGHVTVDLLSGKRTLDIDGRAYLQTRSDTALARELARVLRISGPLRVEELAMAMHRARRLRLVAIAEMDAEMRLHPDWFSIADDRWRLTDAAPDVALSPGEAAALRILDRDGPLSEATLLQHITSWGLSRRAALSVVRTSPLVQRWPDGRHTRLNARG